MKGSGIKTVLSIEHFNINPFTPGRAIWPNDKHRKRLLFRGLSTNIVNVLMGVFYNSLRFHLSDLNMLPPEKRRIIWVLTVN